MSSLNLSQLQDALQASIFDKGGMKEEDKKGLVRVLFGYANEFKEGDASIGLAAPSNEMRSKARIALSKLKISDINSEEFGDDEVATFSKIGIDETCR